MPGTFFTKRLDNYASLVERKDPKLAHALDKLSDEIESNPRLAATIDKIVKVGYNAQMGKIPPQIEPDEPYMEDFGMVMPLQFDEDEPYMNEEPGMLHNTRSVIDRDEPAVPRDVRASQKDSDRRRVASRRFKAAR